MFKAENFHIDYELTVEIAACKQSREVFLTPPLADMIVDEDQPGDLVRETEQWERWVKESFLIERMALYCHAGDDEGGAGRGGECAVEGRCGSESEGWWMRMCCRFS